eukprot:SAG22_NODE_1_length_62449_cov_158.689270_27_plen_144_part_00
MKCSQCKGNMVTPVWPTLNEHSPIIVRKGLNCNGCGNGIVSDPRQRSEVTGDHSRRSQGSKKLITKEDYESAIAVCPDCFPMHFEQAPAQECYCAACVAAKKPFWRKLPIGAALKLALLVAVVLVIRSRARKAGGLLKLLVNV